jgi:hypothetical protein
MRLGQIKAEGGYLAVVFEGDLARTVPGYTVADLIRRSEAAGCLARQDRGAPRQPSRGRARARAAHRAAGGVGLRLHL